MKKKLWLAGLGLTLLGTLAAAPGPQVSGPELAQRLGCWACHSLSSQRGPKAASLKHIGTSLSPEDLRAVLTRPLSRHPQAKMPSYAYLRPWEMQALINYLHCLR